jgi:hypothetical protein
MTYRRTIAASLLAVLIGSILGLAGPRRAAAQKLPVDCSGRRSDCFTQRNCTQWLDHVCYEISTSYWYWYY